jgi:hypothetical protein
MKLTGRKVKTMTIATETRPAFKALRELNACDEAVAFSEKFGSDYQAGWEQCERGDWMLWLIGKGGGKNGAYICPPCYYDSKFWGVRKMRFGKPDGRYRLESIRDAIDAAIRHSQKARKKCRK